MRPTKVIFAGILALAAPILAYAQSRSVPRDTSQDASRLGAIVVTASKSGTAAATLTQAVTVISGDDLRARGVTRVTDALREVPGATLVENGSYGSVTSLFLRGGESRYTKVLIDGVAVNAPGGYFDFSHLTTDNIDRIEIVRGPASVLYGADAVSGVVQIFTRQGTTQREAQLSARGGTYRSRDAEGSVSGSSSASRYSLGAGHHSTNGLLPFNNQYSNGTLSGAASHALPGAGQISTQARYTNAEFHYPTDFFAQPLDTNSYRVQHRLTVGVSAERPVASSLTSKLLVASNDVSELSEDIAIPFGGKTPQHSAFRSRGRRRAAEARLTWLSPFGGTLTGGAEYVRESERSGNASGAVGKTAKPTDGFSASRHNVGYYSELLGDFRGIAYNMSGRLDDNSEYRTAGTYRLAASAPVAGALRIRSSLSTAFSAPAFNQLHPTLYTIGSPGLQPERGRSWEIGAETRLARDAVRIGASFFNQRFDQLIQYVGGGPPDYLGRFDNLTSASANGFESEVDWRPSVAIRTTASFSIVEPRVTRLSPAYEGEQKVGEALLRRPSHSGTATTTWRLASGAVLGTAANYVGRRADMDFAQFPSPTVTLPSYFKFDLSAEVPVTRFRTFGGLSLTARIENLFDRKYENVLAYPAPGRAVFVGGRIAAALN